MLLYIAGEGGVGKTQVINAIGLGYELLQRKSEVLLMAPTSAAAYNIGGRTIHNALCINIYNQPQRVSSLVYSLWNRKTIIIIDEISMVSLTMLYTINQQCNKIQAVQQDSTAVEKVRIEVISLAYHL
jgi:nucleoside-triphosphatase THEP1